MKIHCLEIENYRQFRGKNKIDFSLDNEKNFTVIQGVNGAGKTNILNAITWCLYGTEAHLLKYRDKMGKINEAALAEMNDGDTLNTCVKITLGTEAPIFIFEREIEAQKHNGTITSSEKIPKAWRLISGDWDPLKSPESAIQSLLPERIHQFFFFDGERLDDFFQTESAEDVKRAILDVSQIQLLETGVDHTNYVMNQITKKEKGTSPKIEELTTKIEAISKGKENTEKKLKEARIDLHDVQLEINKLQEKLRNSSQEIIKTKQKQRDDLDTQNESYKKLIENFEKESNRNLLTLGVPVFGYKAIIETISKINEKTAKGELPPKIRAIYLKELLDREECLCGENLKQNKRAKEKILVLLEDTKFTEIEEDIMTGKYALENAILSISDSFHKQNDIRQNTAEFIKKINENNEILKTLSKEIEDFDVDEIGKIESRLITFQNKQREFHQQEGILKSKIELAENTVKELNREIEKETKAKKIHELLVKKRQICQSVIETLEEIKKELIDEVRDQIETNTRKYFFDLIWKKDTFKELTINDDYEISVLSKHGSEALGSLSAGERQVLALSFMSALRGVSGFSAPVIIDTPLGRISGEPRSNIASSLPDYLKNIQVTLLVTDEEYTETVKSKLLPSVNKEYVLQHDEEESRTKVVLENE